MINDACRCGVDHALGRKTKVTEDAGGIGRVTEFAYDRAGRLGTLSAYTDSSSTGRQDTVYTYNGRGQQTIVTYEETGDVTMTYDDVGNMVSREDEAGVVVVYQPVSKRENGRSETPL